MELRSINKNNNNNHSTSILWYPSKRCNYDCSYCSDSLHDRYSDLATQNNLDAATSNFVKLQTQQLNLNISGGEPFLHKGFVTFLKNMKYEMPYPCFIGVTSNASLPIPLYEEALPHLSYLTFSAHLEFIDDNSFIEKIKELRNNSQHWEKLKINLMFLPGHLNRIQKLSDELEKVDINYIIRRIRTKNSQESKTYKDDELQFIKKFYLEKKSKYFLQAEVKEPHEDEFKTKDIPLEQITAFELNFFKNWSCEAGRNYYTIWNDGKVYPCEPYGNSIKSYGDFYDASFTWPEHTNIICPKDRCVCTSDIVIPKWK